MKSFDLTFYKSQGGPVIFAIIAANPAVTFLPDAKWGPYQSPWGLEKLRVLTLRSTGKVQKSEDPTGQLPLITVCLETGNCTEEHQAVQAGSVQNCE